VVETSENKFMSPLEKKFVFLWVHVIKGQTDLTLEHKFNPARRWKFDFAHIPTKVAIELEGGTKSHGHHVRHEGYRSDCEKYNEANYMGWQVFRLTSDMVLSGELERLSKFISEKAGKI